MINNPAKFVREVRQELSRVTWPTRKEFGVTALTVLIFISVLSLFFVLVDQIIAAAVQWVLRFGS